MFLKQELYRPDSLPAEVFLVLAMVMLAVAFHDFLLPLLTITVTFYCCLSLNNHIPILRQYKYLIMLQSLLILVSAFLYNDFNVFGTCYVKGPSSAPSPKTPSLKGQLAAKIDYNCVYPFGVDPIWFLSMNNGNF